MCYILVNMLSESVSLMYVLLHNVLCVKALNRLFCLHFLFRLSPALLRQATYGTIKIGIYHSLKRTFVPDVKGTIM